MNKQGDTHKLFLIMMGLMIFSLAIAGLWDKVPIIKETVHSILNPSIGELIKKSPHFGMIVLSVVVSLVITLVQKYATDQKEMKRIKDEQKELQAEMKKEENRKDKKKQMDLQKQMFEKMPQMMVISMRGSIFTIIPIILLIRWLGDIFSQSPLKDFAFLGISWFSWLGFYIVVMIITSSILRKILKVH